MKKRTKGIIALVLAVAITLGIVGFIKFEPLNTEAASTLDPAKCVTFAEFKRTHAIPDTTIFVGTHLIAMEAANDQLWDVAMESVGISGQGRMFYKSELDGGIWYDISTADSVLNINGDVDYSEFQVSDSTGTDNVEEEMNELLVEYYTFDYGITKRATDDGRHCIFDGEYPYYDLYHLEELQDIRTQYDLLVSRNNKNSKMDKFYRGSLDDFYENSFRNANCIQLDDTLYGMQDIYDQFSAQDKKTEADTIYKLMERIDHQRRAEVFYRLVVDDAEEILPKLLNKANGEGEEDNDDFIVNTEVVNAVGEGISESQASYDNHSSHELSQEGGWLIDELIFHTSVNIIESCTGSVPSIFDIARRAMGLATRPSAGGGIAAVEGDVTKLGHYFNIDGEDIVNKEEELSLIQSDIITEVITRFKRSAYSGVSSEYTAARNAGATASELEKLLKRQETELDDRRLELQAMITAQTDRQALSDAMTYFEERIRDTENMANVITDASPSAFQPIALQQVNQHLEWLRKKLVEFMEKAGEESDAQKKRREADDLADQIQQALADNDLAKARKLDEQRNAVLRDLEGEIAAANSKDNEDAKAKAVVDNMAQNGTIDSMVEKIVNDAKSGDTSLEAASDILSTLGATDAMNALGLNTDGVSPGIGNGLGGTGGGTGTGDGTGVGTGDGTGDGSGTGVGGKYDYTDSTLLAKLENLFGKSFDNMSDSEIGSAIRVMELFYRNEHVEAAGRLARDLAVRAMEKDENYKYLYNKLRDSSAKTEYVNLKALSGVAGCRYIFDRDNHVATLARSNTLIYEFSVGNDTVISNNNGERVEIGQMQQIVMFQTDPFAPVDSAKTYFNCTACDLTMSIYGLCITDLMEQKAQEIYKELKG